MNKDAVLMVTTLLCSIAISFGGATYLLNKKLLYAVALIAFYLSGGLCVTGGKIGTKKHALLVGTGIGFFGAVLLFLPSAFA